MKLATSGEKSHSKEEKEGDEEKKPYRAKDKRNALAVAAAYGVNVA